MGLRTLRPVWLGFVCEALSFGCEGQRVSPVDAGADAVLDTLNEPSTTDTSAEPSVSDATDVLDGSDGSESGSRGCFSDEVLCDAVCTHLRTDPRHCGRCGLACQVGQFCSGGECLDVCPDATLTCGAACANVLIDPRNCGACGVTCREDQRCVGGACGCPAGTTACDGRCVDTVNSVDNCGTCGNACSTGQVCVNGGCELECPSVCGQPDCRELVVSAVPCGGACVSLEQAWNNCGACGVQCEGGTTCSGGECVCRWDQELCDGTCADLSNDVNNCGACGVVCDLDSVCFSGACASNCPRGLQPCGGSCVRLNSDVRNCGACGVTCAGCVDGVCVEAVELALGDEFSCARMSDGSVSCWGDNTDFQLGSGEVAFSFAPLRVDGIADATGVAAGKKHACAIARAGAEVWCWGEDRASQLGRQSAGESGTPALVTALPEGHLWARLALGAEHSCALSSAGEVWCWGQDGSGQLGNGASSPAAGTAVQVTLPRIATELVAGTRTSFVILDDGTLYGWGGNDGDILNDQRAFVATPLSLGVANVLEVAAGGLRVCIRTASGLDCRGPFIDPAGGATAVELPPDSFNLSGATGIRQIWMGAQQTLLLRDSLTVDAIGFNLQGQLGIGTIVPSPSAPIRIAGLDSVIALGAADRHSCAIANGQVACWGSNDSGQVGLNVNETVLSPVPVVF